MLHQSLASREGRKATTTGPFVISSAGTTGQESSSSRSAPLGAGSVGGYLVLSRQNAGDHEDDAAADFHGVVGEALVKAAQQRRFDTGGDAVRPFSIYQHTEQMPI